MRSALLMLVLILPACATVDSGDCRQANWYDVGYRDGQLRLQSQAGAYAQRCAADGAKVDTARYEEGLQHGWYDFGDRWGIL